MRFAAACALSIPFLLCGNRALAQATPAPADETAVTTLRVTTRAVEVSAVVTDKTGEPRTGLTREDFILKQDGKEQALRYFSQGDELPLTFAVLIDTSGSQIIFLSDEERACDIFFETVLGRPQDRAMLVEVNARVSARSEMTNSPRNLHLALSALRTEGNDIAKTRLNDAVWGVSKDVLAKATGRKAIILITDGGENGSVTKRAEAVAEAQRDNVPVYSVEYGAWSDSVSSLPGGPSAHRVGNDGRDFLREWSAATGGHAYTVGAGVTLKHIFTDIAAELRSQYEIGYSLPPDTVPNKFHKLELKAKDKSLKVQARSGFYATP